MTRRCRRPQDNSITAECSPHYRTLQRRRRVETLDRFLSRATSVIAAFVFCLLFTGITFAKTTHDVHFEGTDSELDVFFIEGREPGPVLLLVGGIQGNEPGGYLAADLYADISLRKGSMIVVPRANFLSIVKNARGVRGDMNRKFAAHGKDSDRDIRVVQIIKKLMERSDFFLNLHDGSGFYHPEWESPIRNPNRYGQSIIADASEHTGRKGKMLKIEEVAKRVIDRVNPQIAEPGHIFRFNNHRTSSTNSRHKEQRLSATYHALTKVGIPAFGIETSKNIGDYRLRVRYQTMVINAFMDEFGIVRENPKVELENPHLKYMIVSINGRTPIVVRDRDTLRVQKGDRIRIVHLESNYTRGLTAQLKGDDKRFNYLNREIPIKKPGMIEVRKDRFLIGRIPVEIAETTSPPAAAGIRFEPRVEFFCVRVNNKTYMVRPGEELGIVSGDEIVILDPKTNLDNGDESGFRLDLRGFQAAEPPYRYEDRGHHIDTSKDLQPKYGQNRGSITVYPLQAKLGKKVIGQCYLSVAEPRLDYILLTSNHRGGIIAHPGDKLEIPPNEVLRITDVRTNFSSEVPLFVTMSGKTLRVDRDRYAGIDSSKLPAEPVPLDVVRRGRSLGRIWIGKGTDYRVSSKGKKRFTPIRPVQY